MALLAFRFDPFEEFGRGSVGTALLAGEVGFGRDELAAEGFGEDGLLELLGPRRGLGHPALDVIGQLGQGYDAADGLVLFFVGRMSCCHIAEHRGGCMNRVC